MADIDTPSIGEALNPDGHFHVLLPSFSSSFPLPFRVLLLLTLGILLWALNLHLLHLLGIETSIVLDIRSHSNPSIKADHENTTNPAAAAPTQSPSSLLPDGSSTQLPPHLHPSSLYPPVYKLFLLIGSWNLAGWLVFRGVTGGEIEVMDQWKIIPLLTCLGAIGLVCQPYSWGMKRERFLALQSLKRILTPKGKPLFCDVILADILTSYAKVLGDVWVSIILLFSRSKSFSAGFGGDTGGWVVIAMTSLPYILRLHQCVREYVSPTNKAIKPLLNAVKYATAFPVIILSAAQRVVVEDLAEERGTTIDKVEAGGRWYGEHMLFRLWLLAVFVNSFYSFWWDIKNDWGLQLFTPLPPTAALSPSSSALATSAAMMRRSSTAHRDHYHPPPSPLPRHPHPQHSTQRFAFNSLRYLRTQLLFPDTSVYWAAIGLDVVLRFTWSLKLSSHLHTIGEIESGVFLMEGLELLRRWMWVFLRIEWEQLVLFSPPLSSPNGPSESRVGAGEELELGLLVNQES